MPNVELDDEFLNLFYNITNSNPPKNVELLDLKRQLINIVDTLKELNDNAKKPIMNRALNNNVEEENNGPAILVVDDLGVITYQLKVLLSRFDYDIDCSQEIYDAVNKFKKRKYEYVVMDLFIPTEREGFKEIEQQCRARGADFFLEKNSDWQNSLCNIMDGYINAGKKDEDDF